MTVTLSPSVLYTRHTPKMFVLQTLMLYCCSCAHITCGIKFLLNRDPQRFESLMRMLLVVIGDVEARVLYVYISAFFVSMILDTILWRMQ